jgi:hypothetical protein
LSKIITPFSNATSKSSPTFLAIRLDFFTDDTQNFSDVIASDVGIVAAIVVAAVVVASDCARLKGSTTISGILPSFAFFQTIDNNRIIVGNVIVF